MVEVNNNVSKMLAVHEERIDRQEKADEILSNKIDNLREQMVSDHNSVLQRLNYLVRKVWAEIGAIGVITIIFQLAGPQIVTLMTQTTKTSDKIVEVRPQSLELYRHQVR